MGITIYVDGANTSHRGLSMYLPILSPPKGKEKDTIKAKVVNRGNKARKQAMKALGRARLHARQQTQEENLQTK